MPLNNAIVGSASAPSVDVASSRWLMAYAAGVGAHEPCYFATDAPNSVAAHPIFAACLEWAALQGLREFQSLAELTDAEIARNVHGSFDLTVVRPIRAGETLTTIATIVGVEQRGANGWQYVRVDSRDADGNLVFFSYQGGAFLGVPCTSPALRGERSPSWPSEWEVGGDVSRQPIPIAAGAAHVYSEVSRIWNPVHTDIAEARAAGLQGLILHGTATLAHAVTSIVSRFADGDPSRVRRVACRFGASVSFPSAIVVEAQARSVGEIVFRVINADGADAVRAGLVQLT